MMWLLMERWLRRSTDKYISGRWWLKTMTRYKKMKMRIGQGWSAFCKLDNIMRDKNVPRRLKRKAFRKYILPVMTCDCETWSLSNTQLEKLITTQRKMERIMVRVTLKDRKSTNWIWKQETVVWQNYEEHTRKQTQMCGMGSKDSLEIWQQMDTFGHKRPRGRPRMRWCNDLIPICRTYVESCFERQKVVESM